MSFSPWKTEWISLGKGKWLDLIVGGEVVKKVKEI